MNIITDVAEAEIEETIVPENEATEAQIKENKNKLIFNLNPLNLLYCLGLFVISFIFIYKICNFTALESSLFSAAITLLTFIKIELSPKNCVRGTIVASILAPFFAFIFVELLNENNVFKDLEIWQIAFNMVWYYIIFMGCILITGKARRGIIAGFVFTNILGIANHYVLITRGTVIFPSDILSWQTAMNVMDNFKLTPDDIMIKTFLSMVLLIVFIYKLPRIDNPPKISKKMILSFVVLTFTYIFVFFETGALPALGIYAEQWKTQNNGFLFNFTTALYYSKVDAPDNYSTETVSSVVDEITDNATPLGSIGEEKPVNMIVVMNESFADLSIFDNLETNEDVMPYYRSLTENTIKGFAYPSITGGGTANSEYEFLTGNSLAFLPPNTVAYQLYLNDGAPSMVAQMNSLGYKTVAFHPFLASGWNRPTVYSKLGFDVQMFDEDVKDPKLIRNYIGDKSNYEQIYELTEQSEEPMFIFNVTMQNHSGYRASWRGLNRSVYLTGELTQTLQEKDLSAVNQYLALIRESDDAIKELIEHYEAVDEPTMIVFFGDHQPPLSNDFYEKLYEKPLGERTTRETMQQFKVPFFIWANYDLESKENINLSLNNLGVLACETANIPLTGYQSFLKELSAQLPVINAMGYLTANNRAIGSKEIDEFTPKQSELYEKYKLLAYNNVFETEDMIEHFFFLEENQSE